MIVAYKCTISIEVNETKEEEAREVASVRLTEALAKVNAQIQDVEWVAVEE
jgi:hypothetical protein